MSDIYAVLDVGDWPFEAPRRYLPPRRFAQAPYWLPRSRPSTPSVERLEQEPTRRSPPEHRSNSPPSSPAYAPSDFSNPSYILPSMQFAPPEPSTASSDNQCPSTATTRSETRALELPEATRESEPSSSASNSENLLARSPDYQSSTKIESSEDILLYDMNIGEILARSYSRRSPLQEVQEISSAMVCGIESLMFLLVLKEFQSLVAKDVEMLWQKAYQEEHLQNAPSEQCQCQVPNTSVNFSTIACYLTSTKKTRIMTYEVCFANSTPEYFQFPVYFPPYEIQNYIPQLLFVIVIWLLLNVLRRAYKYFQKDNLKVDRTPSPEAHPPKLEKIDFLRVRSKSCIYRLHAQRPDGHNVSAEEIKKIQFLENREGSQEEEDEYEEGGYMSVNIGDVLQSIYVVIRKLGYGHFSTVWLCKNVYDVDPKYVAIKICKSAHMFAAVAEDEIRLLRQTKSLNPNHPGYGRIVQMEDTFIIPSPNGIHTAIALEIMGPSLLHLIIQSEFRGIQLPGVKRIIYQILQGLTYLHDECHIIHTDIKPENVLIKVNNAYIQEIVERAERFAQLGIQMPKTYVASENWINDNIEQEEDGQYPKFGTRALSYPKDQFLEDLCNFQKKRDEPSFHSPMWVGSNIEIKIADLGNACWEDHHFSPEIQTRQYRALEVILGADYSYPADIWSVGCLAFELATGEMLFHPKGRTDKAVDVDHLSLIWETLGGIPQYITETGTHSKVYFKDGKLRHIPEDSLKIWKIEDVLVEKYNWKRVDAIPFASFIEGLIEPDPGLRITAANALKSEWFND